MVLQGRQKTACETDLAIYSPVVGMSGLWVNVATMLNNKLDFYCCDNSVGYCKSSHKLCSKNSPKPVIKKACHGESFLPVDKIPALRARIVIFGAIKSYHIFLRTNQTFYLNVFCVSVLFIKVITMQLHIAVYMVCTFIAMYLLTM